MDSQFNNSWVIWYHNPSNNNWDIKSYENVYEISNRGRLLYDQFIRFLKDLENVGDNLKKTVDSFQSAEKRLSTGGSRSLVSQAEKLVELGVKSDQKIPKRFKNKHLEEDC